MKKKLVIFIIVLLVIIAVGVTCVLIFTESDEDQQTEDSEVGALIEDIADITEPEITTSTGEETLSSEDESSTANESDKPVTFSVGNPGPGTIVESNTAQVAAFEVYGEITDDVIKLAEYFTDLGMSGVINQPHPTWQTETEEDYRSDFVLSYADKVDYYYDVEDTANNRYYEAVIVDDEVFYAEFFY